MSPTLLAAFVRCVTFAEPEFSWDAPRGHNGSTARRVRGVPPIPRDRQRVGIARCRRRRRESPPPPARARGRASARIPYPARRVAADDGTGARTLPSSTHGELERGASTSARRIITALPTIYWIVGGFALGVAVGRWWAVLGPIAVIAVLFAAAWGNEGALWISGLIQAALGVASAVAGVLVRRFANRNAKPS
jgi:hypothetical protein